MGGTFRIKQLKDGTEIPYEINVTWYSALNLKGSEEEISFQIKAFHCLKVNSSCYSGSPWNLPAQSLRNSQRSRSC